MPGSAERLAQPRGEDHARLPQALDAVDRTRRASQRRTASTIAVLVPQVRHLQVVGERARARSRAARAAAGRRRRARARRPAASPRVKSGISGGIARARSCRTFMRRPRSRASLDASSTRTSRRSRASAALDHRGLGVAHDDVALALVAAASAPGPARGSFASTTSGAELALRLLERRGPRARGRWPWPRRYAAPAA